MRPRLRPAAWIFILACAGCGVTRPNPESLYRSAYQNCRTGKLTIAAEEVQKALANVTSAQEPLYSELRLLQA